MALTGLSSVPSGNQAGGGGTPPDFSKAYIAKGADGKPYVKKPTALWKEVMELRDDALSTRKPHERLWALCWMFYKGDQWRKPAPQPDWNIIRINVGKKPKITINKILPMVATRRAHVLKNRPTGIVMPSSIDEEDRNAARVAQDLLTYDQQHLHNWDLLDGKLSLCMFVTGNAFKKVYYDPTKGEKRERNIYKSDPNTGAPIIQPYGPGMAGPPEYDEIDTQSVNAPSESGSISGDGVDREYGNDLPTSRVDGQPHPRPLGPMPSEAVNKDADAGRPILESNEPEPEGDVVLEFVPPEEILPEPAATCIEDCQRLLHRTLKPIKWVKDSYGDAAENIEPINLRTDRGKSLAQGAKLFGLTEREVANRVEVLEAWYRPSEDFPEGLHAVWADDKLMSAGPTPPAHEHIPFIHYQEIDTDEFWGMSSVSQTIDPQKALNLAVSRDEFMRQRLRPKLMVATEAGLDEAAYSNDDSEIVFVHHPFYPKFTEPPNFTRDEKAVEYFAKSLDDIGGSADIMRGQINGGDIRSGRMVNYLQEYAGTVLSGPARSIEQGEEKTGNYILRLRKHYTDEPRMYYIIGRNRDIEVKQFIGSDIMGAADYVVQAGSALPMSLAEKRDLVLSAVEKGIFMPGDPKIIKLLGFPADIDELFNEDQLDRDNATEENHKFMKLSEEAVGHAYGIIADGMEQHAAMIGMPPDALAQSGIKPTPQEIMNGLAMQPRDFENHEVHLVTHNKARKTKAYKELPKAAQAIFDEHCDMHAMFLLPPPPPPGAEPGAPGPGGPGGPAGQQQNQNEPNADGKPHQNKPRPRVKGQPAAPTPSAGPGQQNAQGNNERNAGMPATPSPPGANQHHLR